MALAEDLLAWATSRPWWQQQVLARLAAGGFLDTSDYRGIAGSLLADPPAKPEGGWLGITLEPFPSHGEQVRLVAWATSPTSTRSSRTSASPLA